MTKGEGIDELAAAVRAAASGATTVSPAMLVHLTGVDGKGSGYSGDALTHRETAVLLCLADGLSNQESPSGCSSASTPCATTSRTSSASSEPIRSWRRSPSPSARA